MGVPETRLDGEPLGAEGWDPHPGAPDHPGRGRPGAGGRAGPAGCRGGSRRPVGGRPVNSGRSLRRDRVRLGLSKEDVARFDRARSPQDGGWEGREVAEIGAMVVSCPRQPGSPTRRRSMRPGGGSDGRLPPHVLRQLPSGSRATPAVGPAAVVHPSVDVRGFPSHVLHTRPGPAPVLPPASSRSSLGAVRPSRQGRSDRRPRPVGALRRRRVAAPAPPGAGVAWRLRPGRDGGLAGARGSGPVDR